MVGFGVVGQAFSRLLLLRKDELVQRYGLNPRIVAVVDRGGAVIDHKGLDLHKVLKAKAEKGTVASGELKGTSALEVIRSVDAEVVVEVTPTDIKKGEPGLSHIEAAIKAKKHVITANKGPLAIALPALSDLARYNKVHLLFSGTVGGGTPVLDFGKRCLAIDRIKYIQGILNGTTNFILTKMEKEGLSFEDALSLAQKLGYAEADPSLDIDGWDTACKVVILANWLMSKEVTLKDVRVEGIRNVKVSDVKAAKDKGFSIKLIGSIDDRLEVKPSLIRSDDPLCVDGTLNAVKYVSEFAGEEVLIGKGAGGMETASAILRDLLEVRERMSV